MTHDPVGDDEAHNWHLADFKLSFLVKREEREHTINDLQQFFDNDKELCDEGKLSTTHSIPLTSRIPLYDRILAEKAHKWEPNFVIDDYFWLCWIQQENFFF